MMLFRTIILSISTALAHALLSNIANACIGLGHTCAVNTSGSAFCWGYNFYGQIGDNGTVSSFYSTAYAFAPLQVRGLSSGVSKVICGDYFSCAILTTGAMSCWGSNAYGQLGDGTFIDRLAPSGVSNMDNGVTFANAGSAHTCAIKLGAVWCWGSNGFATLGQGTCCGGPSNVPVAVALGGPNTASALAAGAAHTCALRTDGPVFCWGSNGFGQIGSNDAFNTMILVPKAVFGGYTFTGITAGAIHTCASSSAAVLCWGGNSNGQLGSGTLTQSSTPVQVLASAPTTTVTAGAYFTCVTTTAGVSCWGQNNYGQLGLGYYNATGGIVSPKRLPPPMNISSAIVFAGTVHACGLAGSSMYCWGYNGEGELGICSILPASYALPLPVESGCPVFPVSPAMTPAAVPAAKCSGTALGGGLDCLALLFAVFCVALSL